MDANLTPVILVVGGSSGIGQAVARNFSTQNARVIVAARDQSRLEESAAGSSCETVTLDATDSAATEAAIQSIAKTHGRLDGVVNCAGSILLKPAHLIADEEFLQTINANLLTAFNVLRASARLMMKQAGGGSIVLCSSVAARRGLVNHEAIAAAKAGVEGLALAAAATYARYSVRVNCVAPGLTRTEMSRPLTQNENVAKISAALHPLGRIGEPADVASAICWLLSPGQTWVTGQVIGVDGGLSSIQARG